MITSQDTTRIYHSKIWKDLEARPSKIHELDAPLAEHGFYQLLNIELTFREEGLEKTEQQLALFHWTERWVEALILVDSRI